MPNRSDDLLSTHVRSRDFRAIERLITSGKNLADTEIETVIAALTKVEFGQFTLTPGWWSLVNSLLMRSRSLREHVFAILGGEAAATATDAYRATDRSNLLHAVARLNLTADELGLLQRLRSRLPRPQYQEDVDAVLYEFSSGEDQRKVLEQIWFDAAAKAAGREVVAPTPSTPQPTIAVVSDEARWQRSPFRLLACMPFRVPAVAQAWTDHFCPAFAALGDVLRLDWSTDDWVRDVRRLAASASYVLVDLSSGNLNVRRELRYLLVKDLPHICYANGPSSGVTTVGQLHPSLASSAGSIDAGIWGEIVYTANYINAEEVRRLIENLDRKLHPFVDERDPTGAYVGRDLSALPAIERRGFELAHVPRTRTSAERLLNEGKKLIAESAIFRARIFARLADPHLHMDCPENTWLREHLLMLVEADIRQGHRLSPTESKTLQECVQAEAYEELKTMGEWIVVEVQRAPRPCPAERHGLPPIPSELPSGIQTGPRVRLRIAFAETGEPVGLKAAAWQKTFGTSAHELRRIVTGKFGPPSGQCLFAFEADGPPQHGHNPHLAEMEDTVDAEAGPLGNLTLEMNRNGWTHEEVETFLSTTVSLTIIRELRRRGVYVMRNGGGGQEHEQLAAELSYIWECSPSELRLFEFASKSRQIHFRGLFPWKDVKEQAIRLYAAEAAKILDGEIPEAEIFAQAMDWDIIPAQPWDAILRPRMPDVTSPEAMRGLWARYVLPSAFLYWRHESIFADPMDTRLWAYV